MFLGTKVFKGYFGRQNDRKNRSRRKRLDILSDLVEIAKYVEVK